MELPLGVSGFSGKNGARRIAELMVALAGKGIDVSGLVACARLLLHSAATAMAPMNAEGRRLPDTARCVVLNAIEV